MTEASTTLGAPLPGSATPRERILEAAYELFSRHGLEAVGVNSVVERSGIAKRSSTAISARRTSSSSSSCACGRNAGRRTGFSARSRARAAELEVDDRSSRVRQAALEHLANIRSYLE